MVDVTHDGHDRRTDLQILVVLVLELLREVDVEAVEQLLVLVLGRDDLHLVAELGAQHLEGGLVERLGGGRHLTELEQHGDQVSRRHREAGQLLDLLGEVGDRRAAAHPDDRAAVATRDGDAADRRGIAHLEFGALRALRLAGLALAATACRTHQRCHRRVRGHGHRHRDVPGRSHLRRRDAPGAPGRPAPPAPPGAPPGRKPRPRRRLDAAGSCRDALPGHRDAERRDAAPAGAVRLRGACPEPRRRGCCPDAAIPGRCMPWLLANGLLPGRGIPGLGMLVAAALGASSPSAFGGRGRRGGALGLGECLALGHREGFSTGSASTSAAAGASGSGSAGFAGAGFGAAGAFAAAGLAAGAADAVMPCSASCRLDAPGNGRGDARRRALDELAHVLELLKDDLAFDAEFGCDLVHAWVGHCSPVQVRPRTGSDD